MVPDCQEKEQKQVKQNIERKEICTQNEKQVKQNIERKEICTYTDRETSETEHREKGNVYTERNRTVFKTFFYTFHVCSLGKLSPLL
jgi:hypothetical protein